MKERVNAEVMLSREGVDEWTEGEREEVGREALSIRGRKEKGGCVDAMNKREEDDVSFLSRDEVDNFEKRRKAKSKKKRKFVRMREREFIQRCVGISVSKALRSISSTVFKAWFYPSP